MPRKFSSRPTNPSEQGQGLVEYALIVVLVAVVVILVLLLLGPAVGNSFSSVSAPLEGNMNLSPAGPTATTGSPFLVTFNCSDTGWVDVKNMSGGPNPTSFSCDPSTPYTYNLATSGRPAGTKLKFQDMYYPYAVLANATVP